MPNSKLAFFRYLLIDQMLRDKRKPYPSKQELLEACEEKFGVRSVSTIEKDINAMRLEFDAPIEYSKRMKGYHYTESSFKLLSVNLSDENLVALGFVESFLEDFKAMPIFSEFSDAVDKVLDGLEITRNFGKNLKPVSNFIQLDKSPYFKGSEMLSQLIQAIADQKVVLVHYKKFNSDAEKEYTIHPYIIKEFQHFWYLTGYVEGYNEVRTFGIDRITAVTAIEEEFKEADTVGFNANAYFKNCLGVTTLDRKPEKVVLSFSPQRGNYLKSQPLHASQKILVDNDDEFKIELLLISNFELRNVILSFGADVKVLEPASLKESIIEAMKTAIDNY